MYGYSWPPIMNTISQKINRSMSLKEKLEQTYNKYWSHSINSCQGKLKVYTQNKKLFRLENYLLQFPLHLRQNFSKLWISAHYLAV